MKLLISTTYRENYGDAEKPFWKPKGGYEYVVKNVDPTKDPSVYFDQYRNEIERDNKFVKEFISSWKYLEDDELTPDEQEQMEWEGKILFKPVTFNE